MLGPVWTRHSRRRRRTQTSSVYSIEPLNSGRSSRSPLGRQRPVADLESRHSLYVRFRGAPSAGTGQKPSFMHVTTLPLLDDRAISRSVEVHGVSGGRLGGPLADHMLG